MRRPVPAAVGYVEAAARTGEEGGLVRSRLGQDLPAPSAGWLAMTGRAGGRPGPGCGGAGPPGRPRPGPFTCNFVVQASAADWALVLLAAPSAVASPARGRSWSSSSTTR